MVLGALPLLLATAADGDGVVVPTAAQLRWMQDEIGAIGALPSRRALRCPPDALP